MVLISISISMSYSTEARSAECYNELIALLDNAINLMGML
jgi:hypothetical protein